MARLDHSILLLLRLAASAVLALMAVFTPTVPLASEAADLFDPIVKVLQHPRCVNCHPGTSTPLNGDDGRPHIMKITRGADGLGAPGARCYACHRNANGDTIVPGAPRWSLAPASMAWRGLSRAEVCAVLKDPGRNGGRTPADLVKHMNEDKLVLWAWNPGKGRTTIPIPHEAFIGLLEAWVAAGAPCPE